MSDTVPDAFHRTGPRGQAAARTDPGVASAGALAGPMRPRVALVAATGLIALVLMFVAVLALTPGLDGIRMAVRATARTSLVFFLMAFAAGALFALWPSRGTRWLRLHRRQWGWLLAASHTLHALALVMFWQTAPARFWATVPMATWVMGGLAFAVIWAMGATSFDRTAAWLGPRAWSILHTWGGYYIWMSFMSSYAKRIVLDPVYLLPTLLLAAVMAVRAAAWWQRRRRLKAGPANVAPA